MQAPEILGGRYELRGILGRGGMAEVRDAWDRRLDRPVAVKLLHPVFSVQPENRLRFEIEARAAAGLNHPHIVAVHDSGEHAAIPFIVMERLSGWTLADELTRGPLPQDRVRAILDAVLSAIAAAHAAGILHRDIKPANILFTATGDVKVADFGIAKSAGTPATMTGQIVGTMAYLSADRVAGRPATVADDLYAVGAVGYEALTGRKPFPQNDIPSLARAIAEDSPQPLQMIRPDVTPGLAATIERAMARDPRWHFPSAEAMRAALYDAPYVAPQPNSDRPPTRVLAEPLPPPATMAVAPHVTRSRRRTLAVLAAALLAVALAVILLVVESTSSTSGLVPATTATSLPSSPSPSPSATPPPPAPPPAPIEHAPPEKKKGPGPGHGPRKGD